MSVTITPSLTMLNLCDSTTSWVSAPTQNTEFQVEGVACNSIKVSQATVISVFTLPSAANLQNTHLRTWMMVTTVTAMDTQANGGMRLRVEDGSGNFGEWYVGGKDTYGGGWRNFCVDTAMVFQNQSATGPTMTAITKVGVVFKVLGMSSAINCFWDVLRYGDGLWIGGGTQAAPGTFEDIYTTDVNTTNAWGVVRKEGGVYFAQGKLMFGNTAAATTIFRDLNQIVVFEAKSVAANLYEVGLVGNASVVNEFKLGSEVGVPPDSIGTGGVIFKSAGPRYTITTTDANVDSLSLYGCQLIAGGQGFWTNPAAKFISGTISKMDMMTVTNSAVLRDSTVTDAVSVALDIPAPPLGDTFRDMLVQNSPVGIRITATGTQTYDLKNIQFAGNSYDVMLTGALGNGWITMNVLEGGDTPIVYDPNSIGYTVSNPKVHTITGCASGSRVVWIRQSDEAELENKLESAGDAAYSYNYVSDVDVWVQILSQAKKNKLVAVTLGNQNQTLPAAQEDDPFYTNPA